VGRYLKSGLLDLGRAHSTVLLLCVAVIFLLRERETKCHPLSRQGADEKPRAKDVVGSTWRVGAFRVGKMFVTVTKRRPPRCSQKETKTCCKPSRVIEGFSDALEKDSRFPPTCAFPGCCAKPLLIPLDASSPRLRYAGAAIPDVLLDALVSFCPVWGDLLAVHG
jgi:hypothetical protein